MRLRLSSLLVLTALAGSLAAPSAALAAGTGGIEVTPDPAVVDGRQVTAFHVRVPSRGTTSVSFFLRNTTSATVTGRVYAADAARDPKGQFTIGGPGSATDVSMPTEQVTLAPREVRHQSFRVRGPVHGTEYRAVVVEVQRGAITQRAATLVYLKPGRRVPVPVLLAGTAAALLLLVAAGIAVARRRPRALSRRSRTAGRS